MRYSVFVDGQGGTTGLRLFDYLANHSHVRLLRIEPEKRKDSKERARLLNASDVAFLCLPDAAAHEAVTLVENGKTCLIDASTAFRTSDEWVYGLPELALGQRRKIRESKRIANVGCHASAFILLIRPLVDAGVLPSSYPVSAFSQTGYSGGGKAMIAAYEEQHLGGAVAACRTYALGMDHKHLPEMKKYTGLDYYPAFVPSVGGFFKGLSVSVPLQVDCLPPGATPKRLHEVLTARYQDEPFVRVMPQDSAINLEADFFDPRGSNGTNRVDLFVFGNEERCCLIARLDNLGKGAAGAAVQNMNIHLGIEEGVGLPAG